MPLPLRSMMEECGWLPWPGNHQFLVSSGAVARWSGVGGRHYLVLQLMSGRCLDFGSAAIIPFFKSTFQQTLKPTLKLQSGSRCGRCSLARERVHQHVLCCRYGALVRQLHLYLKVAAVRASGGQAQVAFYRIACVGSSSVCRALTLLHIELPAALTPQRCTASFIALLGSKGSQACPSCTRGANHDESAGNSLIYLMHQKASHPSTQLSGTSLLTCQELQHQRHPCPTFHNAYCTREAEYELLEVRGRRAGVGRQHCHLLSSAATAR